RERLDALEMLMTHFYAGAENDAATTFPPDLISTLRTRTWTGNARELRNFVDRMRTLGHERALAMTDVYASTQATASAASSAASAASSTSKAGPPPPSDPNVVTATDPLPFHAGDLPADLATRGSFRAFRDRWTDYGERLYVHELLTRHDRNVSAAAREAELDR